jgi:drug/metabolite transporter (DMT)-like permease
VRYQSNNLLGIGLMMLAMLLFVIMDALAKWLVSAQMSAIQLIAIRSWIILPIILLVLAARGQIKDLTTRQPLQHMLRGCCGFLAPVAFFTSLKSLPLADATVIFFSSTFILTAASALFLKERVGLHRWSAVLVGFIGVVIAMDPRGGGDLQAYLLVLTAATIYAMIFVSGKHLSRNDSVISLVFSLHLGMGLMSTLALPWVWVPGHLGRSLRARRVAIMPKSHAALMGQALRFVAPFDKDWAKAGPTSTASAVGLACKARRATNRFTPRCIHQFLIVRPLSV